MNDKFYRPYMAAFIVYWGLLAPLIVPGFAHKLDTPYDHEHNIYQSPWHLLPGLRANGTPSLPVPNPTKSFWTHGSDDANPLAKEGSEGELTRDADVCIIGSGITGVSSAYHLAKTLERKTTRTEPLKTVILEARDFCSGATGRNGGHLTPAVYANFRTRSSLYGLEEAKRTIKIEQYTVDEVLRIIEEEGLATAIDLVEGGHVTLFFTDQEEQAARADAEAAKEAGIDMKNLKLLDKEKMLKVYGTNHSAYHWSGYNLWPLKLVTELFQLANSSKALDLYLHTKTPVTSVVPLVAPKRLRSDGERRRWALETPRGPIHCSYVLHATNGYAAHLLPHLSGPEGIVPVRGQVMATRAAVPATEFVNASYGNAGDEYWFPRPSKSDGEHSLVILGGARHMSGPPFEVGETDDSKINEVVSQTLKEFLPAVFTGKFEIGQVPEMEWTGIMGYTTLGDPFVGPVLLPNDTSLKGQFVAAGYSGHGMPRAFACAEVIAQMVVTELTGRKWKVPSWLPRHYLTWARV